MAAPKVGTNFGNFRVTYVLTSLGGSTFAEVKKGGLVDGYVVQHRLFPNSEQYAITGEEGDWRVRRVLRTGPRKVYDEKKPRQVFELSDQAVRQLYGGDFGELVAQI